MALERIGNWQPFLNNITRGGLKHKSARTTVYLQACWIINKKEEKDVLENSNFLSNFNDVKCSLCRDVFFCMNQKADDPCHNKVYYAATCYIPNGKRHKERESHVTERRFFSWGAKAGEMDGLADVWSCTACAQECKRWIECHHLWKRCHNFTGKFFISLGRFITRVKFWCLWSLDRPVHRGWHLQWNGANYWSWGSFVRLLYDYILWYETEWLIYGRNILPCPLSWSAPLRPYPCPAAILVWESLSLLLFPVASFKVPTTIGIVTLVRLHVYHPIA